jgi:hypothetical protein
MLIHAANAALTLSKPSIPAHRGLFAGLVGLVIQGQRERCRA